MQRWRLYWFQAMCADHNAYWAHYHLSVLKHKNRTAVRAAFADIEDRGILRSNLCRSRETLRPGSIKTSTRDQVHIGVEKSDKVASLDRHPLSGTVVGALRSSGLRSLANSIGTTLCFWQSRSGSARNAPLPERPHQSWPQILRQAGLVASQSGCRSSTST